MAKIKVLLVDDQVLFVMSLRTVLDKIAENIAVVGIATSSGMAFEMAATENPDIILMDIRMPEMNGVECTRIIHEKYPAIKILMLTTFDDEEYVFEALRNGAVGYILKNVPPEELVTAIRAVYEGGVSIAPQVASKLVKRLVQPAGDEQDINNQTPPDWLNDLSTREKDVLSLIAQGLDNKEIAKRLHIGEQTVKNYVSIIYYKMGVRDRVQIARMAKEAGL